MRTSIFAAGVLIAGVIGDISEMAISCGFLFFVFVLMDFYELFFKKSNP